MVRRLAPSPRALAPAGARGLFLCARQTVIRGKEDGGPDSRPPGPRLNARQPRQTYRQRRSWRSMAHHASGYPAPWRISLASARVIMRRAPSPRRAPVRRARPGPRPSGPASSQVTPPPAQRLPRCHAPWTCPHAPRGGVYLGEGVGAEGAEGVQPHDLQPHPTELPKFFLKIFRTHKFV